MYIFLKLNKTIVFLSYQEKKYLSGFDKRYLQKFQVRFNNLTLELNKKLLKVAS